MLKKEVIISRAIESRSSMLLEPNEHRNEDLKHVHMNYGNFELLPEMNADGGLKLQQQ